MEEPRLLSVTDADKSSFKRLDHFLVHYCPDLSRSLLKKIFDSGDIISPQGQKLELKKMPPIGTEIEIDIPPPVPTELVAQNIPLEILYEDEWLIVINKPAGLCVHPAPGHPDQTLVNAILWHCPNLHGVGQEKRPGIVHRLDIGTSGVMVVAKEHKAHEELVSLFSRHEILREYEAITWGRAKETKGCIKTFINRHPQNRLKMSALVKFGKNAVTYYELKKISEKLNLSHLSLRLETGRTHQIRVHLSQILHTPILNDELYSDITNQKKQLPIAITDCIGDYRFPFLHAKVLGFKHPITGQDLRWEVPAPEIFNNVMSHFP